MSVSVCVSLCVCLSVRDHIFGTKRPIFTQFFTHAVCGCGSVFLWRRDDMLRISGFMDDVIFAPKLRLLDVAARLRQRGSQRLGYLVQWDQAADARGYFLPSGSTRPQWAC